MPLTDAQKQWINDPRNDEYRSLLLECDHSNGVIGLCTVTPHHLSNSVIIYDAFLAENPVLDETITDHVGVGDFKAINNLNPDEWARLNFTGRECRWRFGDVRWPLSQFWPVANAIIQDVQRDDFEFTFNLVNRGFLLEKNIEQLEVDVSDNQIEIPITLGDADNVTGVLVDYAHQIYQVHNGASQVVQVRDNGVPVSFTADPETGKVILHNKPVGTVSFDVRQPDNNALKIAQYIAGLAGFGEIKHHGLAAWQRLAVMGFQITGEPTYASVLDQVADSIGGWWRLDALGKIELVSDNADPVGLVLTENDIVDLQPSAQQAAVNTLRLHYHQNAVVLDDALLDAPFSAGVISESEKSWLSNPDAVITRKSTADTGLFKQSADYYSHIKDADDALKLMDLLMLRDGTRHRSYSGEIRGVAYGLRVGDRVELLVEGGEGVRGIARVDRLALGSGDALSDAEFVL